MMSFRELLSAVLILSLNLPARLLAQSSGVPENILSIRAKAESGDPVAEFKMGKAYEDGSGLPQNYELALNWYKKAAQQGNSQARMVWGSCISWDGVSKKASPRQLYGFAGLPKLGVRKRCST